MSVRSVPRLPRVATTVSKTAGRIRTGGGATGTIRPSTSPRMPTSGFEDRGAHLSPCTPVPDEGYRSRFAQNPDGAPLRSVRGDGSSGGSTDCCYRCSAAVPTGSAVGHCRTDLSARGYRYRRTGNGRKDLDHRCGGARNNRGYLLPRLTTRRPVDRDGSLEHADLGLEGRPNIRRHSDPRHSLGPGAC